MDFFMKDQHAGISSETNDLQTINFHGEGDCGNVELKEQDLIKQLEEKESNDGDSGSVLDCALTLAPSGLRLWPMDRSNHAWKEELVYVPTNCQSNSPQVTTGIGSSSWNGHSGRVPTSDAFANFHVIPNFVLKNTQDSNFLHSKENVGDGRREGMTTTRRCCFCQTTSTPLWRNGPKGSKCLCNACGIRYKKEERKALATTAAAASAAGSRSDIAGGGEQDNGEQRSAWKST